MLNLDKACLGQDHGPFDDILKFPDISREAIVVKRGQYGIGHAGHIFLERLVEPVQKIPAQHGDVLGPVPEGRHFNADGPKPLKQFPVEPALADLLSRLFWVATMNRTSI